MTTESSLPAVSRISAPPFVPAQPWPRISLVTAFYNGEDFLEDTILSIFNQHYPNLEYIIIYDGSTDSTPEIVRDNIIGLLFENGDPQDLARALRLLLASTARRLQILEACRRTALQEYDLLVQARRHESLYRELCTTSAT